MLLLRFSGCLSANHSKIGTAWPMETIFAVEVYKSGITNYLVFIGAIVSLLQVGQLCHVNSKDAHGALSHQCACAKI